MENKPVILPHWLEVLDCCGVKTQLAVIKALVKYQAEGVMPDFKGTKLALFNFLVRDLSPAEEEKMTDGNNKPERLTPLTPTVFPTLADVDPDSWF